MFPILTPPWMEPALPLPNALPKEELQMETVPLVSTIGLYQPLDGITNLKYKLMRFLTPNKKFQKEMH